MSRVATRTATRRARGATAAASAAHAAGASPERQSDQTSLWACPECGSDRGVEYRATVSGYQVRHRVFDGSGAYGPDEMISNDGVRYRDAAFGTCLACGTKVRVPPPVAE